MLWARDEAHCKMVRPDHLMARIRLLAKLCSVRQPDLVKFQERHLYCKTSSFGCCGR